MYANRPAFDGIVRQLIEIGVVEISVKRQPKMSESIPAVHCAATRAFRHGPISVVSGAVTSGVWMQNELLKASMLDVHTLIRFYPDFVTERK